MTMSLVSGNGRARRKRPSRPPTLSLDRGGDDLGNSLTRSWYSTGLLDACWSGVVSFRCLSSTPGWRSPWTGSVPDERVLSTLPLGLSGTASLDGLAA